MIFLLNLSKLKILDYLCLSTKKEVNYDKNAKYKKEFII